MRLFSEIVCKNNKIYQNYSHSINYLTNQVIPKEKNILLYPESIHKTDNFLLKIININLAFYKKLCYNEVKKWDKLWNLLTIDNQEEMNAFTEGEKMLNHYQKTT